MKKFVFSLILVSSIPALGADSSSKISLPAESKAKSGDILPESRKRFSAEFLSTFHGPTLEKFGPDSVNGDGKVDPSALTGFDNELWGSYLANDKLGFGPHVPFVYSPNRPDSFSIGDVGLKMWNTAEVPVENLTVHQDVYFQTPTSNDAHRDGMVAALRTTPFLIYDIAPTRWRIGTWSDIKFRFGVNSGQMAKVWIGPYVTYKITDRVWANLLYETEADHFVGDPGLKMTNVGGDFQPGIIWRITPSTRLNPYLQIFPTQPVATAVTAVGAQLYSEFL